MLYFQDLHDFLRLICLRSMTIHGGDCFNSVESLVAMLFLLAENPLKPLEDKAASVEEESSEERLKVASACREAICVVVEESLSAIQTRVADIDSPSSSSSSGASGSGSSSRKRSMNIYGGIFPLEEVTDMIFRTMSPAAGATEGLPHHPGSVYSTTTTSGNPARMFSGSSAGADGAKPASRGELVRNNEFVIGVDSC